MTFIPDLETPEIDIPENPGIPVNPTFGVPKESKLGSIDLRGGRLSRFEITEEEEKELDVALEDPDIQEFAHTPERQRLVLEHLKNLQGLSTMVKDLRNSYYLSDPNRREYDQSRWRQQSWWQRTISDSARSATFNLMEGSLLKKSMHSLAYGEYVWDVDALEQGLELRNKALRIREAKNQILKDQTLRDLSQRMDRGSFGEAFLEAGAYIGSNPNSVLALSTEAIVSSIPSLLFGAAGGVIAGASSRIVKNLAQHKARTRAIRAGQAIGAGTGAWITEDMVAILEVLEREGLDAATMTDQEWYRWSSNPDNMAKLQKAVILKGGSIAALTMLGVVAIQSIRVPQTIFSRSVPNSFRPVLNSLVQLPLQTSEEMAGEALGQKLAYDEVILSDVMLEGLGAGPMSVLETFTYGRDRAYEQVKQLEGHVIRRKGSLEKAIQRAEALPDQLQEIQKEWPGNVEEVDLPEVRELFQKKLGPFRRIWIDARALQGATHEELRHLQILKSEVAPMAKNLAFIPIDYDQVIENKEIIPILRKYAEDIKVQDSLGGKTLREARLELETLEEEIIQDVSRADLSDLEITQRDTLDGIKRFIEARLLLLGQNSANAEVAAEIATRAVTARAQQEGGNLGEVWERYMYDIFAGPRPEPEDFAWSYSEEKDFAYDPELTLEHPEATQDVQIENTLHSYEQDIINAARADLREKMEQQGLQQFEDFLKTISPVVQAKPEPVQAKEEPVQASEPPGVETQPEPTPTPVQTPTQVIHPGEEGFTGEVLYSSSFPELFTHKKVQEYVRENFIRTPKGFSRFKIREKKGWLHVNLDIPWGNLYPIPRTEETQEVEVLEQPPRGYEMVFELPESLIEFQPEIDRQVRMSDEERGMSLMDYLKRVKAFIKYSEGLIQDNKYPSDQIRIMQKRFLEEAVEPREVLTPQAKQSIYNLDILIKTHESLLESANQITEEIQGLQDYRDTLTLSLQQITNMKMTLNEQGQVDPLVPEILKTQKLVVSKGKKLEKTLNGIVNASRDEHGFHARDDLSMFAQDIQRARFNQGQFIRMLQPSYRLYQTMATRTGLLTGKPVRFKRMGSGYVFDGIEGAGEYLDVRRALEVDPEEVLEIEGESIRVSAFFKGKDAQGLKKWLRLKGYDALKVRFKEQGRTYIGYIPTRERYYQRGWLTRLLAVPMSEWIQKLPEENLAIVPDLMRIPDFEVPKAYKNLQDLKRLLETMRKEKDYTGIKFGNPDEFLDYLIPRIERVLKNPGMRTLDEFIDILPEEHKEIRPSIEKLFGRTILLTNKINSLEDFYKSLKGFSPKDKRNREDSYTLRNNIRKLLKGEHVEAPKPVSKPSPEPEPDLITPKPISEVSIEPTKTLPPDYDINVWRELKQFLNYKRFLKTHVEIREFFAALGFKEPQGFDSWNIKQKHKYLRNLGYLNSKADIQKYINLHKLTWKDIFSTFKRKGKPIPFEQIRRTLHTLIVQRLENKEDINNFLSLNQITVQGDFHERSLPRQKRFLRDIPLDVLKDERHLGAYAERNNVSMLEFATKERLASLNLEEPYLNPKVRPEGSVQAKGFRLPQGYEDLQHEVNSVLKTAELYEGRTPQEVVDALRDILKEIYAQSAISDILDDFLNNIPASGFYHHDPFTEERYIEIYDRNSLSTFLHEMAHWVLEVTVNQSERGVLDPEIKRSLEEGLGTPLRYSKIGDKEHEVFARSWEAYLFDGKVPEGVDPRLERALNYATLQIKGHYIFMRSAIRSGKFKPSEPVIALMDRIVLGSEIAEQVLKKPQNIPLGSESDLGESPEEYSLRKEEGANAARKVRAETISALLQELKKVNWNLRKEVSEKAIEQEQFALLDSPMWNAVLGMLYNEETINTEDALKHPRIPQNLVSEDGRSADEIAEKYEFNSGEQLMDRLSENSRMNIETGQWEISAREEAKNRARQKLDVQDGIQLDQETIRRIGEVAAGALDISLIIARDLVSIRMKGNPEMSRVDIERQVQGEANRYFQEGKSQSLNEFVNKVFEKGQEEVSSFFMEGLYDKVIQLGLAQNRASRESTLAFKEGRLEDAERWKGEELRLHQMTRALSEARAKIAKDLVEADVWERGTPEGHDPDYRAHIVNLLRLKGVFGTRVINPTDMYAARRFIEDAQSKGISIESPETIFQPGEPTVKDMLDLGKAVRSLSNAARKEKNVKDVDEDPEVKKLSESIKKGHRVVGGRMGDMAYAELIKPSHWFKHLDRGELGLATKMLFQPISEAASEQAQLSAELFEIDKELRKWQWRNRRFLNKKFSVNDAIYQGREILTMAELYMSEAGREALMEGERGFTDEHIQLALKNLDDDHAQFLQSRQNLMKFLLPRINDFKVKVLGIEPEAVMEQELQIGNTLVQGGYSMIAFDLSQSRTYADLARERADEMIKNKYIQQFDRLGSLSAVEDNKGRPVSLDIDNLYRGMTDAVHTLTMQEPTGKVSRLLKAKDVRNAIISRGGQDLLRGMEKWLTRVRAGHLQAEGFFGKLLKEARINYTLSVLGYSIRTAVSQVLGLTTSAERLGVHNLVAQMFSMEDSLKLAKSKSSYMRNLRPGTLIREQAERTGGRTPDRNLAGFIYQYNSNLAYKFMVGVDLWVSGHTWATSYNQNIRKGLSEKDAVFRADLDVRELQGSGELMDLSTFMAGPEAARMLTLFATFFSALTNLVYDSILKSGRLIDEGKYLSASFNIANSLFWLIILPRLMTTALLGEGPDEDDPRDEDYLGWFAKNAVSDAFQGIPLARDLASAWASGFPARGPAPWQIMQSGRTAIDRMIEGEWDNKTLQHAAKGFGSPIGFPTVQFNRALQAIYERDYRRQEPYFRVLHGWGLRHGDLEEYFD